MEHIQDIEIFLTTLIRRYPFDPYHFVKYLCVPMKDLIVDYWTT